MMVEVVVRLLQVALRLRAVWIVIAISCLPHSSGCGRHTDATSAEPEDPLTYPVARHDEQEDDYHGTKIKDPYRWLEDADSPETKAWVESENRLTQDFLARIPARAWIHEQLTRLWNYERYGVPHKRGGNYFYTRNDGLQNQSVLYVADSPDAKGRVLLDPNSLSKDGTTALAGFEPSPDGQLLAYGLSVAGSDWQEWRVRNVSDATDREDLLQWIKFSSVSWLPDSSGFYYSRYDEPTDANKLVASNYYQKLYFHKLGTPQSDDRLIYERPDEKEWGFEGTVTEDGHYLLITVSRGTERKNRVLYQRLDEPNSPVMPLVDEFEAEYAFITNEGPHLFFHTDDKAPLGRVVAADVSKPDDVTWREILMQREAVLEQVTRVGGQLLTMYLQDAHSLVRVFDLEGSPVRELTLPGLGTVAGMSGHRDDTEAFYAFTGFSTPVTIYRYNLATGDTEMVRQPKVTFDPADFETRQQFIITSDDTKLPMFISYRKGLKIDSKTPTYLFGYGGFNIPLTPQFSVQNLVWMQMGGMYVVPNLRGGGEYGSAWHEAGQRAMKQNVFNDFIAAAEWLIGNRYTSTSKLAIAGRSNGGLLVGACLTQEPYLFGAAVPSVGVLDMLRFHRFTIGWAWVPEYGSSDNANEFPILLGYSPLHNIRPGSAYPPTLITTADHDDRVVPAHSYKFAAALQAAQVGKSPVLIRIDTDAGHGGGKPTSKAIDEATDILSFLVKVLGMEVPPHDQSSE